MAGLAHFIVDSAYTFLTSAEPRQTMLGLAPPFR